MTTIKDCDREAAASYYYSCGGSPNIARDIRQGKKDDWFRVKQFAAHRELGAREGVAEVVAYLRSQAAIALVHDLPLMEGADKKRLDLVIVALEKYADAIERGEHRNP